MDSRICTEKWFNMGEVGLQNGIGVIVDLFQSIYMNIQILQQKTKGLKGFYSIYLLE
jgi:hypothetical protein